MSDRCRARVVRVRVDRHTAVLASAASIGATTLLVRDAGDLAEESGTLLADDDAGTVLDYSSVTYVEDQDPTDLTSLDAVTLTEALAVALPEGTELSVWDDDEVLADYIAACVPDDDEDAVGSGEPIRATIPPHMQDDLPTGKQPGDGVRVVLEYDDDADEWSVVRFVGSARGIKFEADDFYTLTTGDTEAATVTFPLSHQPIDESVKLWWRTVAQEPTEYTVNYDAQTITLPLASFAAAGDPVWVHYAYQKGLTKEVITPEAPGPVPLTHVNTAGIHVYQTISNTQSIPLGSVLPGDLIVFACIGDGGTIACPDPRMSLAVDSSFSGNPLKIWVGKDNGLGSPLDIDVHYDISSFLCEYSMLAIVVRPDSPVDWTGALVDQTAASGTTVPGVSGVSGVVALAFSDSGTGGDNNWYYPSPYLSQSGSGLYLYVTSALQEGPTIAGAVVSTNGGHTRRAILLGIGLG